MTIREMPCLNCAGAVRIEQDAHEILSVDRYTCVCEEIHVATTPPLYFKLLGVFMFHPERVHA